MEEICSIKRNCFEACDEISGESLQQPELARKEETLCVGGGGLVDWDVRDVWDRILLEKSSQELKLHSNKLFTFK